MATETNQAAWIMSKQARPLKVDDAPMPTPKPNQVVIRNHAISVAPVDYMIQQTGMIIEDYPNILGNDVAGVVTKVGSDVTNVKVGDRVVAGTCDPNVFNDGGRAFQLYVVTFSSVVAKIPDKISFAQASVLPLAINTAAIALYQDDNLHLPHPMVNPKPNGKVLFIWGGSTSVGSCAIQMAKASGFEVATTVSMRNADYCKSLGADYTFDYTKENVVDEVVEGLKGKDFGGAYLTVQAPDAAIKCTEIIKRSGGNQFLATVYPHTSFLPEGVPSDIKYGTEFAVTLAGNEVGPAVYHNWMPQALETGALQCKPEAEIYGRGLDKIQDALDLAAKGVSAKKIVVELP